MNITEFLLTRIAEDEQLAREAIAPEEMYPYGDKKLPRINPEDWGKQIDGYVGGTWGTHAARHDPTRVLRDCEAKRAIIGLHTDREGDCEQCSDYAWFAILDGGGHEEFPCPTIRALATVYWDHADYQQEWQLSPE